MLASGDLWPLRGWIDAADAARAAVPRGPRGLRLVQMGGGGGGGTGTGTGWLRRLRAGGRASPSLLSSSSSSSGVTEIALDMRPYSVSYCATHQHRRP